MEEEGCRVTVRMEIVEDKETVGDGRRRGRGAAKQGGREKMLSIFKGRDGDR